jgi:hypothetical protein
MAPYDLSNSPPDAIAYHRAAQRPLDAEAEAAHGQMVGAGKNCEVGTGSALSGAVNGIEVAALHQPRLARKFQKPGAIRA